MNFLIFYLGVKVTRNVAQYPLHHVPYSASKFEVCCLKRFKRRCIYKKIQYLTFELNLVVKVTRNVAQYPLHHVTFSTTKIEVATSNGLGGEILTRNVTDRQTDGRATNHFGTKLIYPFFLKKQTGKISRDQQVII